MKKIALSIVLLAGLIAPALAAPTVKLTASAGSWPSAPYNVNILDLSDPLWTANGISSGFKTFCVEWNVVYYPNTMYYATIDDTIKFGANPTLQDQTKKIYSAFLNGGNAIGSFTGNQIQSEIWYWQNGGVNHTVNGFVAQNHGIFASLTSSMIDGWQNVKVLNLWKTPNFTGDIQSQLVRIAPIPAPAAVLLTGIGTALVGLIRRRNAL